MRTPRLPLWSLGLAVGALAAAGSLAAQQSPAVPASAFAGVEFRGYSFEDGFPVDAIRQVAVPLGVMFPIGDRLSVDIGTAWARTSVEAGGTDESFSALTDTQIRASYIFGNDAVVTTLMVNLPTGKQTTTLEQFSVTSSVSSNFLLFPVNSYGSATSVTGGVAAATAVGSWNLGVAGSLRMSSKYQPFKGDSASNATRYKPGLESRLRVGADRLLGSSRLALGFTFSTFSNDEFSSTGGGSTNSYNPGNRYIGELTLTSPVGGGAVTAYLWNYYRENAGNSGTQNKENVFTGGLSGNFRLGQKAALLPFAEARLWSPEDGSGRLFGFGSSVRLDLSPNFAFAPGARVDFGSIKESTFGSKSLTGFGATGLLQYSF